MPICQQARSPSVILGVRQAWGMLLLSPNSYLRTKSAQSRKGELAEQIDSAMKAATRYATL
jgi:hypothetical protein